MREALVAELSKAMIAYARGQQIAHFSGVQENSVPLNLIGNFSQQRIGIDSLVDATRKRIDFAFNFINHPENTPGTVNFERYKETAARLYSATRDEIMAAVEMAMPKMTEAYQAYVRGIPVA